MTGNLSRTVLRGAGARESACLPDLTKIEYDIQHKKRKKLLGSIRSFFQRLLYMR
ncbi:hypothetical protein HNP21_005798 [Bacillus aryabhattai]|uniref:Uncharacterized protein n=1 Tax=Priestia aryabhattai TaxID=412384 RepID=A0A7W3RHR0_PRIAR|nr:hypothetical protein [Priestia aryabhattai]